MKLQRWAASAVRGSAMEKINLPFFYQLGTQLNPLTKMNGSDKSKRIEIIINSISVSESINTILKSFPALTVCRSAGTQLVFAIREIVDWYSGVHFGEEKVNRPDPLINVDFQNVIDSARKFEVVLEEELQMLSTYQVSQKGIYSTPDLIDRAESTLPPEVLSKIDQRTKDEIRESGRCLAFDNFTASGFHIIRATESVIQKYYLAVCDPKPAPNRLENWGAYISKLHELKRPDVDEIVALLQQIKDQHRNLIMHPEIVLNFNEAYTLFEISKTAIMVMASKMPILDKS